jgi:hypothetical protein
MQARPGSAAAASREGAVVLSGVHAGAVEQLVLGGLVGAGLAAEQHGGSTLHTSTGEAASGVARFISLRHASAFVLPAMRISLCP